MASCLGLYIEENLIKYAKVSKEKEETKVEAFGIKFYDKLSEAIKQIVSETYSYKTPISVNLSNEMYNYFYMFSMLNQKDLKKAIETEFESYCYEKGYNVNALEKRYAIIEDEKNKEQIKVMHISVNKTEINKKNAEFEGYRLTNIVPISTTIGNIVDMKKGENILVVNIEKETTITKIIDQKISNVEVIEDGAEEFLRRINSIENSYAKSYEMCKNSTIYTIEGKELQPDEENTYLEYIMPTLYNIVGKVQKIINESEEEISKVLLTGTGTVVNNID